MSFFIAIPIEKSSVSLTEVQQQQQNFFAQYDADLRLEKTFHLTLAYLNSINPILIKDKMFNRKLQKIAINHFIRSDLTAKSFILLSNALTLEVEKSAELITLREAICFFLDKQHALDLCKEPFIPHITLVRFGRKWIKENYNLILLLLSQQFSRPIYLSNINRMILYHSDSLGNYQTLQQYYF